jgi:lambda family phage tail tape measure protein
MTKAQDDQAQKHLTFLASIMTSSERYGDQLADLTARGRLAGASEAEISKGLQQIRDGYSIAREPAEQFRIEVAKLDDQMSTGLMTQKTYDQQMADLVDKFHKHDEAKGMADGIKAITQSMDVASQTQKVLVDGFNGITQAISDMVTKGKADWAGLIQSMLQEMTKLLLFKAIMAMVQPGGGAGIGGDVGSMLAGHDRGARWTVGQGSSSAPDTSIQMFRASRGETVQVIPNGGRGGDGGGGTHVTVKPNIINAGNQREAALAAMNTSDGESLIMNTIFKNIQTIKGHIRR